MGIFHSNDNPVSRRLLFIVGALLVVAGLGLGLLEDDEPAPRTAEEAAAHVASIDRRLTDEEDAPPSELDLLRDSLDFSTAPEPRPQRVEGDGYDLFVNTTAEFLVWLYEAVGYTADQVASGETTAIPPLILVSVPRGWAEDKTVQLKKSLFYRAMLPLVLLENEAVLDERATLEAYRRKRLNRSPITPEEHGAARALAAKYGVLEPDAAETRALDDAALDELLVRVDMVPPSLALGQAAYESGYATSRFAHEGNALFGQWDWGADAIKPAKQRAGRGDYGIKAFPYPVDSVRAYLWNLNTHRSYQDFRRLRAEQRDGRGGRVKLDGQALAGTLLSYSERGEAYTKDLQGIMSFNRLELADDVRLLEGEPVYFH